MIVWGKLLYSRLVVITDQLRTYYVVVIGGGASGVICASAAPMKGASVAVVENKAEKRYIAGDFSQNRDMVIDILNDVRNQAENRGDLNLACLDASPDPDSGTWFMPAESSLTRTWRC
jgi:hypothetical protein